MLLAGCGDINNRTVIVGAPSTSQTGSVRPYRVPSGSMEPTLSVGQVVSVQLGSYSPHVGDIVVFHPPRDAEQQVCGPAPHVINVGGAACAEPEPVPSGVKFIKRIVARYRRDGIAIPFPTRTLDLPPGSLLPGAPRE